MRRRGRHEHRVANLCFNALCRRLRLFGNVVSRWWGRFFQRCRVEYWLRDNVDMTGPNARSTVFCAGAGCGLLGDATSSSAISEVICDTAGDCSWFPNSLKGGWCCRGPGCSSMSMPTCL